MVRFLRIAKSLLLPTTRIARILSLTATRLGYSAALVMLATLVGCNGSSVDGETTSTSAVEIRRPLPEFTLSRQDGAEFGSKDLLGRVWIGNFIFTRCASTCPQQTKDLVSLQNEFADHPRREEIHFVSITVDPEHDTQQQLAEYAKNYQADLKHWSFLTGERKKIWKLCEQGFALPVFHNSDTDPGMLITHSEKCVVVDRENRIRGFYDTSDEQDRKKLTAKIEQVLAEEDADDSQ